MSIISSININHDGKSLHYKVIDETGIPVFLIHGFTEDSSVWRNQIGFLKNCQLFIPDLPGVGESEIQENMLSLDDIAEIIITIADREKLDKFVVIGHSMGGYISLAFAKKYPDRLIGLGLFHSSALADTEEKKESRQKSIEFILRHGSGAFVKTAIPDLFYHKEEHKEIIDLQINSGSKIPPSVLVQHLRLMKERIDTRPVLEHIKVPVLWILGEHDKAIRFEDGLSQVTIASQAEIHILRASGHMGMLEEPVKATEILQNYIDLLK